MLFPALALLAAATSQTQDYAAGVDINGWLVVRAEGKSGCSIVAHAGASSLAFFLQSDGALNVVANNGAWKPEHHKHYDGMITMVGIDTPLDAVGVVRTDIKPSLAAAVTPDVANDFRTASELLFKVPALNVEDRYTITDGAKIWAALQSCNAAA